MVDFLVEVIYYTKTQGAKNTPSLLPMGEEAGESLLLD